MDKKPTQRLESLDILRGFDLFCLVALCPFLWAIEKAYSAPWYEAMLYQFEHVHWEGFVFWDIIMPLFMFMAGVSMPFALAKYIGSDVSRKSLYLRIIKRVAVLWIFGMMCQGNLLAFDLTRLRFFSNTLQAIAIGYLFSSIIYLNFRTKWQIVIVGLLLMIYWGAMEFFSFDGYGAGGYGENSNLAEYIDIVVLGRWRDGVSWSNGAWSFSEGYRYTWILSSINFVATVMSGVFAGAILKSKSEPLKKALNLLYIGIALIVVGYIWGYTAMPIIKKIWTSSMVFISSGYCFLLMSLFYYLIDYKGYKKGVMWLKIYGMNSIVAYMLVEIINFSGVSNSLFFGLEQFIGAYYGALINASNAAIVLAILYLMYKNKIFLKA